ncbi:MAG: hypothetical protein LBH30_01855 [Prevotellaceae bacterium]|nr:hypothetical protein [Prevotellaceae bacterium]
MTKQSRIYYSSFLFLDCFANARNDGLFCFLSSLLLIFIFCLRPFRANFAFYSFHRALPCAIAVRASPFPDCFYTSLRGVQRRSNPDAFVNTGLLHRFALAMTCYFTLAASQ